MDEAFILGKSLRILFIGGSLFLHSFAYTEEKPVVLQWRASHPRYTDSVVIVFNPGRLQMAVNTSLFQKKNQQPRLGVFQTVAIPRLQLFKEEVLQIYNRLKSTVPLSSMMKIDQHFQPQSDPHAPVIYINKEKIKQDHFDFKLLAGHIYKIWEHQWRCIECAFYKKSKKSITRVSYKPAPVQEKNMSKRKKIIRTKKRFSQKQFKCISQGKNRVECVDPEFGIFKI